MDDKDEFKKDIMYLWSPLIASNTSWYLMKTRIFVLVRIHNCGPLHNFLVFNFFTLVPLLKNRIK